MPISLIFTDSTFDFDQPDEFVVEGDAFEIEDGNITTPDGEKIAEVFQETATDMMNHMLGHPAAGKWCLPHTFHAGDPGIEELKVYDKLRGRVRGGLRPLSALSMRSPDATHRRRRRAGQRGARADALQASGLSVKMASGSRRAGPMSRPDRDTVCTVLGRPLQKPNKRTTRGDGAEC
jgi:hypothetical protein